MSHLAINGGPKIADELKTFIWPRIHPEDESAVLNAIRNNYLGGLGDDNLPNTVFERKFAAYHDALYGTAIANGTLTLETSLRVGGVRPGDEVIVPAITFIASASAIVSAGAVPVFVDVDPLTCQISAEAIKAAITPKTRAIIIVHFGGYMADLDAILPIAHKHGLIVVEDCAHAQGSAWRNKRAGSWGTFGSFSFQHSKSLSAGEGGIVITNDAELYEKTQLIRNIGRMPNHKGYDHSLSCSNWRMGGLQGAFLLSQFERFPAQAESRHMNGAYLSSELNKIPGIRCLPKDDRITQRGYYFMVLDFDAEQFGCSRDTFFRALQAEGVTAISKGYNRPINKEGAFLEENLRPLLHESIPLRDYSAMHLPHAERWASRMVTILHWYFIEREAADLVLAAVTKVYQHRDELKDLS